ncbi:MAG: phage adaptor protein [Candidatus Thorarchaeota archaeon]|jgi:hypothetical protein
MATLSSLRTEVQLEIGNRTHLNTYVDNALNRAIIEVVMLVRPPEQFTTFDITGVAGQANYDIKTTNRTLAIIGVIDNDNDRRIFRGSFQEYDEMDPTSTGTPNRWFRYGNAIFLYNRIPEGSEDITVRIIQRPAVLSSGSDTFPLNLEWEDAVIARASYKMLTLLGMRDRAMLKNEEFLQSAGVDVMPSVTKMVQDLENEYDTDARMRAGTHRHRPETANRSRRG